MYSFEYWHGNGRRVTVAIRVILNRSDESDSDKSEWYENWKCVWFMSVQQICDINTWSNVAGRACPVLLEYTGHVSNTITLNTVLSLSDHISVIHGWVFCNHTLLYRFHGKFLPEATFQIAVRYFLFLILCKIYNDAHKTLPISMLQPYLWRAVPWPASPSPNLQSLAKFLTQPPKSQWQSWSHKYYVLCFPHRCLMFHIEVGTIKQTTAHKRMGPLIPRGIILVEGVFSTGPARKSY